MKLRILLLVVMLIGLVMLSGCIHIVDPILEYDATAAENFRRIELTPAVRKNER